MLREPCEHGRYERHLLISPERTDVCDPRFLTDAEALERLLYKDCENEDCDALVDAGDMLTMDHYPPCPSCGGSGRTLREGVDQMVGEPRRTLGYAVLPWGQYPVADRWYLVPASMLKGGE